MKLNKTRQKLYLDGKVGLINDGTVEQLREVTDDREYMGKFTYYHKNRIFPSEAPLDNVQYQPIEWFYENEMELPKKVRVDKATGGCEWYADFIGKIFDVTGEYNNDDYSVLHSGGKNNYLIAKSDCTPINETNNELPKVGEWWECVKSYNNQYTKGKKYLCEINGKLTDDECAKYNGFSDADVYNQYFIKSTPPYEPYKLSTDSIVTTYDCTLSAETTPTSYKLNIDIPEWLLKAGDEIEAGRLPRSIIEHIAIPIYTQPFTLENGTQIELTNNDIDKIKKM